MSKNEFDALLLKKLEEETLEYKPESWRQLSERLDDVMPVANVTNQFDTLLVEKINAESFEYNPEHWKQLTQKLELPVSKTGSEVKPFPIKKWGIAIGTAAAICLVFVLAIKFGQSDKDVLPDSTVTLSTQPSKNNPPATIAEDIKQDEAITKQPANTLAKSDPLVPNKKSPGLSPTINQPAALKEITAPKEIITESKTDNKEIIAGGQKQEQEILKQQNGPSVITKKETPENYLAQHNNQPWPESPYTAVNGYKNSGPKTNLSFGGGVNYGNLNTGYTAGVSVKRKITKDFFVDGTVAMMYNNNATNVAANNGPSVGGNGNIAARPSSFESSISSPALDPIQRLYYVQFNPSVGYQIEDKVALSVGGDFQQILNKRDEIIQPNNSDTKVFPNFDVGITTKSEFTITPNIQAGLVYREGLNNLLKGDGGKYVNRRYFQVQFKYNLPLK